MVNHPLDHDTRKALCVHLGEQAGRQIAYLIYQMAARIDSLERRKVDIMPIVKEGNWPKLGMDRDATDALS